MSLIAKIEGTDINTGIDLDRNVKESVSIKRVNDKTRSLSCALYYRASDTFPTEGQDVQIYDDTTLLFGGIIKTIDYEPTTPETGTSAWTKLTISSDGYNFIPQRRTVNVLYESTTAGAIVSALITAFLADEGISAGTISTGATIDRYSGEIKSVKEILDDMADASGYTWNINDDKELDFIAPTSPTTSSFELIEGERTHFGLRPRRTLDTFRNKQFVVGGVDSTGATVSAVVEDSANIAARASAEGNSGVYGHVIRDTNIQTTTDAEAAATEALNRNKNNASLSFGSYEDITEGQLIQVTYPKYGIATDTKYLVLSKTITRDGHKWKYAYSCEVRDESNFSARAKDNSVDFISNLSKPSKIITGATGSSNVIVQPDEPTGASENTLWVDTDDFSRYDIATYTTATTIAVEDGEVALCNGTFTLTLFAIADLTTKEGVVMIVKNIGTGAITVAGNGSETIDGSASISLASQYDYVQLISDGTNWAVIG